MRARRFVGLVLMMGILALAFPVASEAGVLGHGPIGDLGEPSFFARVAQWVQGLFAGLGEFLTVEGAGLSGNG